MLKTIFAPRSSPARSEAADEPLAFPTMSEHVASLCHLAPAGATQWYPPVMIGAPALGERVLEPSQVEAARDLLLRLDVDDYAAFMTRFYEDGLARFGAGWRFADIVTVLLTLAEVLQPRRYLEIGVRRGRSACAVASRAPACDMALFDMWIENYAGMANPGPDFVRSELAKVGHRGDARFIDGDSHRTLPRYFGDNRGVAFDLITVDGDHSDAGATQDLRDVLPHLAIGGAVVFDDVCHPTHPGLRQVWQQVVAADPRFTTWMYDQVGYGVAFAIRKW